MYPVPPVTRTVRKSSCESLPAERLVEVVTVRVLRPVEERKVKAGGTLPVAANADAAMTAWRKSQTAASLAVDPTLLGDRGNMVSRERIVQHEWWRETKIMAGVEWKMKCPDRARQERARAMSKKVSPLWIF